MDKKFNIEKEATIAANWWGTHIGTDANKDNGDLMQSLMTIIFSYKFEISEEKRNNFIKVLKNLIIKQFDGFGKSDPYNYTRRDFMTGKPELHLNVDYDPDAIISQAVIDSNVVENGDVFGLLPVKTTMVIKPGSVSVWCGYRASEEKLYDESNEKEPLQPGNVE
jgi:hypothetical protein